MEIGQEVVGDVPASPVPLKPVMVSQLELQEEHILSRGLVERQDALYAKRTAIEGKVACGAEIEPGPLSPLTFEKCCERCPYR